MPEDLELQAEAIVGKLVFAFSRLDFMLALALRNLIPSTAPSDLDPLIERLGFKERLDALRELVLRSTTLQPLGIEVFEAWYPTADRLRSTRNAFVHGRWGMQTRDTVFNASTKVGRALSGETKNYSLPELEAEAIQATKVLNAFNTWHRRYVLGAA